TEPFDLDAVLCQQLVEFAALLGDQVEAAQAPGQTNLIGGAAVGAQGVPGDADAGEGTDTGRGGTKEAAAGWLRKIGHGSVLVRSSGSDGRRRDDAEFGEQICAKYGGGAVAFGAVFKGKAALAHYQDAVGERDGLVDVVRHQQ